MWVEFIYYYLVYFNLEVAHLTVREGLTPPPTHGCQNLFLIAFNQLPMVHKYVDDPIVK